MAVGKIRRSLTADDGELRIGVRVELTSSRRARQVGSVASSCLVARLTALAPRVSPESVSTTSRTLRVETPGRSHSASVLTSACSWRWYRTNTMGANRLAQSRGTCNVSLPTRVTSEHKGVRACTRATQAGRHAPPTVRSGRRRGRARTRPSPSAGAASAPSSGGLRAGAAVMGGRRSGWMAGGATSNYSIYHPAATASRWSSSTCWAERSANPLASRVTQKLGGVRVVFYRRDQSVPRKTHICPHHPVPLTIGRAGPVECSAMKTVNAWCARSIARLPSPRRESEVLPLDSNCTTRCR